MKSIEDVSDMSWARKCLAMARTFTIILNLGLFIMFDFMIVALAGSDSLYWRTGARTIGLTAIEHIVFLILAFVFIIGSMTAMFSSPFIRQGSWSFLHGALIGYSFPYGLFLIGEATSWFNAPSSPTLTGLSVLSAAMGGMVLCGIFVYWMLLAQPSTKNRVNNQFWFRVNMPFTEASIIAFFSTLVVVSAVCMLWLTHSVQTQQAFTLIINALAYLFVLLFLYLVRVNYLASVMTLGILFGATLSLAIIGAKWAFNFASRWTIATSDRSASLFMAALVFNAGMSLMAIPLLAAWKRKEFEEEPTAYMQEHQEHDFGRRTSGPTQLERPSLSG